MCRLSPVVKPPMTERLLARRPFPGREKGSRVCCDTAPAPEEETPRDRLATARSLEMNAVERIPVNDLLTP